MSSKDLLKELMKKTDLTVKKLSERSEVNEKSLVLFLEKDGKLEIEEYIKLGKYFGLSLETMATGVPVGFDKDTALKIRPAEIEIAERFLNKCENIILESGLKSRIKDLVPQAIYSGTGIERNIQGFVGGVFLTEKGEHWKNVYMPYIDLKALLNLDDYEIYSKLKKYPRTLGQLRFYLNQIGDQKGLTESLNRDGGRNNWTKEIAIPKLVLEDVLHLSDVNFYKELDIADSSSALYKISDTNKNYWKIINCLLEQGAYLVKGNLSESFGYPRKREELIDYPATQMLRYIAKQNLK